MKITIAFQKGKYPDNTDGQQDSAETDIISERDHTFPLFSGESPAIHILLCQENRSHDRGNEQNRGHFKRKKGNW